MTFEESPQSPDMRHSDKTAKGATLINNKRRIRPGCGSPTLPYLPEYGRKDAIGRTLGEHTRPLISRKTKEKNFSAVAFSQRQHATQPETKNGRPAERNTSTQRQNGQETTTGTRIESRFR